MDIKPPQKSSPSQTSGAPQPAVLPHVQEPRGVLREMRIRRSRLFIASWLSAGLAVILIAAGVSTTVWYRWALNPRSESANNVRIVINTGETSATIAETLYDHDLIRSKLAFRLYTKFSDTRSKLQAGGYVFSSNQDVRSIVEHMVDGKTDELSVTIPPGLTLNELRAQFKKDGFSDSEITQAFSATYSHPLLASKPPGATLEGYIYPETYRVNADQSLQALLERSFDEFYGALQKKKYIDEFAKHGLTIHQAVTLASIVQKEVTDPTDQRQVAQVFYTRLATGMQLGSDVTYMYAAKQLGVEATPSLESPYNTRKYAGLPPGPIANMNPSALDAVAFPAPGDYVFFVAGDGADAGRTFFARTEAEHIANIAAHCHTLCN